jgi:hypothetical protein
MPAAAFGFSLLVAMVGQHVWTGGVIKIEQRKSDNIWRVHVYCGGPEARRINPAIIRIVEVHPKAKDPFSGRLLIAEMRDLLKSQEIVGIRFNWDHGVCVAVAVEADVGLKLHLEERLP